MSHTPGPWRWDGCTVRDANDSAVIGAAYDGYCPSVSCLADAQLIAAAPDLLEALEAWMEYAPHAGVWTEAMHQEFADLRHKAFVAIAKAKGENRNV